MLKIGARAEIKKITRCDMLWTKVKLYLMFLNMEILIISHFLHLLEILPDGDTASFVDPWVVAFSLGYKQVLFYQGWGKFFSHL